MVENAFLIEIKEWDSARYESRLTKGRTCVASGNQPKEGSHWVSRPNKGGRGLREETKKSEGACCRQRKSVLWFCRKRKKKPTRSDIFWKNFARFYKLWLWAGKLLQTCDRSTATWLRVTVVDSCWLDHILANRVRTLCWTWIRRGVISCQSTVYGPRDLIITSILLSHILW